MPPVVVSDILVLARSLGEAFGGSGEGALFTVDGMPGSGKSELCERLRQVAGCVHIKADDYLTRRQDVFLPALRVAELGSAVRSALDRGELVLLDTRTCNREAGDASTGTPPLGLFAGSSRPTA
jgi:archaellum biogenesis ATPase FlaH